ncbi:MAG: DUF1700 domain-containing protein [Methanospirillum sp.]|nr:DUF1700 domain-containing protein [Methanospirillum sp.]
MKRDEYLRKLEQTLSKLSQQDWDEILGDYSEHFAIGLENGRNEEEIAAALGDPQVIGREYTAVTLIKTAEDSPSARGMGRAIAATLGLGLFNLVVVLVPFIILVCIILMILLGGFSLVCAGPMLTGSAVLIIAGIFPMVLPVSPVATVFFGIGITCMGLLVILGDYWLSRMLYRLGIRYLKWNIAVIHGRESL